MVAVVASLLFLAAMGAMGVAALRRLSLWISGDACADPAAHEADPEHCARRARPLFGTLEQVAYGAPLGLVVGAFGVLLLALVFGLQAWVVVLVGGLCAIAAVELWGGRALTPDPSPNAGRGVPTPRRWWHVLPLSQHWERRLGGEGALRRILTRLPRRVPLFALIVLCGLTIIWAVFYRNAMEYREDGLWAVQQHVWSDWPVHLGHTTSFAYADNFPPEQPYFSGNPFNYHFLASLNTAAMVKLGMDPVDTLRLHDLIVTVLITLAVFAFARRLSGNVNAAALAVLLFMLGSGLGWILTAQKFNASDDLLGTLRDFAWNYDGAWKANFRWEPVFIVAIAPTRGFLYGLPIGVLVLALLYAAVRLRPESPLARRRWALFLAAGAVAGTLPYAHLGTLLALAMVTPFLFLLFPSRGWVLFFGAWIALAVPQLLFQGGASGGSNRIDWHIGWMAPEQKDSVLWFWIKNMGLFLPLLVLALLDRLLLRRDAWKFLLALMPIFVIANLFSFDATGPWNNLKVLIYWFLGVCVLVGALVVRAWEQYRAPVVRTLLAGAALSMVLSGLLMHLHVERGGDDYMELSAEEVYLADQVRALTPPHAVFAAGLQHNHPVTTLAGRQVLLFFPPWLVSWGLDPQERERDIRQIFAYAPNAPDLMRKYGVDYVVIGPSELNSLGANVEAYRARYPVIIKTRTYEVFDVRQETNGAPAAEATGR